MMHENKQFAKVERVDNIVLPMVQDKIMLIPHIDLVIPEEFDMVEFKVFLFSMLPRVILDLKQLLLVSILDLILDLRSSFLQPEENDVGDARKFLFCIIYVCKSIVFLCFRSY